jgi:hypothetical protein
MAKILAREAMQLTVMGKARMVRIYKNTARENLASTTNEAVWSKRIVAKNARWWDTVARDELLKHLQHTGYIRDGEARADLHDAVHEVALGEGRDVDNLRAQVVRVVGQFVYF